MRILDRYLLKSLAGPLGCCLAAFTMVFVIFDLFNHLDDFVQGGASVGQVLGFYLWVVPNALVFISPISMLLSVLYCLSQLTKNNELTAMRACGVSVFRLTAPFLGAGLALAAVTAAIHETLAPEAAYRTQQFVRAQRFEDKRLARMAPNLGYRNQAGRRSWMIRHFDTETFDLFDVEVIEFTADGLDRRKINAPRATWTDGRWWFRDARIQEYDPDGYPLGAPRRAPALEMAEWTETPRDFLTVVREPQTLSARELLRFREAHPSLPADAVARLMVDFHGRLAAPWMTLIVTLLGIPFGNQTARKGALAGVLMAMALFFGFYVIMHFGLWAGKESLVPAWFAGWAPNLLFLGIGIALLSRMR